MLHKRLLAIAATALIFISACGRNDGHVRVYPVQGKVIVRGAPAEGARIVFYPVSEELKKHGMPVPDGTTDAQGTFKLKSYKADDGAPEGEFKIGVIWLEQLPPDADPDVVSAKDRLGGRYGDPQKSQLTAKVEKGGGEIPPFELQ
jgi:hypothetical protein